MTRIGPDLGDDKYKWWGGAILTDSGVIYCVPRRSRRGILKIDTNTDNVTELDANLLPEGGPADEDMWLSCAAAPGDGCIYFMPANADRILKVYPNNGDAMSSVGDVLVGGVNGFHKYIGTVVGID